MADDELKKDDLRKLPPEERIRRLRELERKRKKEIEEAQETIRESEEELTEEREWKDKVPIPEVAKEELEGLGEEGKEILKVHKNIQEKKKGEEEPIPPRRQESLEETIERENVNISPAAMGVEYGTGVQPGPRAEMEYSPLRQRPMTEVYQEAVALKQLVQDKGYISRDDERKAEYLSGIVQERMEASELGKYSFTEETAKAASLIQQVGSSIRNAYKRGTSMEKNWYR